MSLATEREFMKKEFPEPMRPEYYNLRLPTYGFGLIDECHIEGKLVLDLGAFAGYVGYYCKKKGARVVLMDIFSQAFPKPCLGVEAAKENLPFNDNTFDFVVCNDTLHHGDLVASSIEIQRILKPAGVFISTREPCISSKENEAAVLHKDCKKQLDAGLDERRPNLLDYKKFCMPFSKHKIFSCYPWQEARDCNYGGDGVAIWCQK